MLPVFSGVRIAHLLLLLCLYHFSYFMFFVVFVLFSCLVSVLRQHSFGSLEYSYKLLQLFNLESVTQFCNLGTFILRAFNIRSDFLFYFATCVLLLLTQIDSLLYCIYVYIINLHLCVKHFMSGYLSSIMSIDIYAA